MSSPVIGSPAYNNESIAWKLMTTDLVTIIIAFLLVVGRLYTKFFLTKAPGWEDWFSVSALFLGIARVVGDFFGIYHVDMGRHIDILHESELNPFIILVAVDGLMYVTAITLAKFAILIFLYRIFKVSTRFRYTSWAVAAIMGVWALVTVLLVIFSCKPLAAGFNYKLRLAPTTVCKPESYNTENIFGFCNIFADFMLLAMPMPLLWTLHMSREKKIGVSVVFANGAVIAAIAIVRQYFLFTSPDSADPSWEIVQIKIWMTLEVNLAITCGCLPVLQPLFRKLTLLIPFLPSHIRTKVTAGRSAMEQASWPKKLSGPACKTTPDDVENGFDRRNNAPWREPDQSLVEESSDESVASLYHEQQLGQVSRAKFEEEPAFRMDRLGEKGVVRGVAL